MKLRFGFVTNSSSSSFIISKGHAETKEDVYQMLRSLYLEFDEKFKLAIEYTKSTTNIDYSEEKGIYIPGERNLPWEYCRRIRVSFEQAIGVDLWDFSGYKSVPEWVNECATYEEYESYWKVATVDTYKEAPFTIGDFLNPTITWLCGGGKTETIDTGYGNETLNWYFDCAEDFPGCTKDFSECPMKAVYETNGWWSFDMDESMCKKIQSAEGKDNICYKVLGRFCIYSESGYIPNWIVDQLSAVSEYSCNHMG